MTLFEQGVTGMLSMTHLRLTVTDDEKDNVIFVRRKLVSEPEPEQRYTLPPEAVREIRGIIAGEPRLFSLEDQDAYWVCDGSAESFRNEELVLEKELAGYAEYKTRVRYKLIPFLW